MRASRLAGVVAVAGLAAGCFALPAAETRSLDEVRAFADDTARSYGLPQIHVLVSHNPESPVGSYRRGFFAVNELVLRSEFRDAIVAHELAHYVLGHDAALAGATPAARLLERQQRGLDANAKSVDHPPRVRGVPQAPAPGMAYRSRLHIHRPPGGSPGNDPRAP